MWFSKDYWISHLFCCVGKSFKGNFEIGSTFNYNLCDSSIIFKFNIAVG
jgi:hypothetical protein